MATGLEALTAGAATGLGALTFSTGLTGGAAFLTGFSAMSFLIGGAFFAGAGLETGAGFFAGAAFLTGAGFFAGAAFLTGAGFFAGAAFLVGTGFLTRAAFSAGAGFFPALATGFFAAGAGFEDLTTGFAPPLEGADFLVFFFAAMEKG